MANQPAQCLHCSENISQKRSDAKFCDDRCRMRHQRHKKRVKLVQELAELCSKVPNHIRKNESDLIELYVLDTKSGRYEKYDQHVIKHVLMRLSMDRLRRLVRSKRAEILFSGVFNRR